MTLQNEASELLYNSSTAEDEPPYFHSYCTTVRHFTYMSILRVTSHHRRASRSNIILASFCSYHVTVLYVLYTVYEGGGQGYSTMYCTVYQYCTRFCIPLFGCPLSNVRWMRRKPIRCPFWRMNTLELTLYISPGFCEAICFIGWLRLPCRARMSWLHSGARLWIWGVHTRTLLCLVCGVHTHLCIYRIYVWQDMGYHRMWKPQFWAGFAILLSVTF